MNERDDLVLIKNYEENPSHENAEKVAIYWWKHGWWPLILSNKNNELIAKAYNQYQDIIQDKETKMQTERCPFNRVDCEYIPLAEKASAQADEIERLREALEYYANPNRFESEWDEQFKCWVPNHDSGKKARSALKQKDSE